MPQPVIYLDLDGVIADFTNACNRIHGRGLGPEPTSWNWYETWGIDKDEFWEPINALGDDFYPKHVDPYPWAHKLIEAIHSHQIPVSVATASPDNTGLNGKRAWVRKFTNEHDPIIITEKWRLAHPAAFLIDDNPGNVQSFVEAGGGAFLWPRPWNDSERDANDPETLFELSCALNEFFDPDPIVSTILPTDKQDRKNTPLATGFLDYFPRAAAAVAHLSYVGNEQHNPGQPLHWNREKSTDHADCIVRHLLERGTIDTDGVRHSAKVAWRALANLEVELEQCQGERK